MFEVGKIYTIRMQDGESQSYFEAKLLSVDLPLIEVEHGASKKIINVGSVAFVSADRDDEELVEAQSHFLASMEPDPDNDFRYDELHDGGPKAGY